MKQKSAWILSLGIILASLIFGLFFYNARQTEQTIRVVGYSTHDFEADIVKWSFSFSEIVPLTGLKDGYSKMNDKLNTFRSIWKSLGIKSETMNIQPISVNKRWGQYGKIEGYTLEQNFYIITQELDKIKNVVINPQDFTKKDIAFESSKLQYFSTRLSEIKKQLLAAATKNAMERADEIATSTGKKVDKIQSARAGVFQITEPYSNQVSGYGMYQTSTRNKTIKVTVTAVFSIK